MRTFKITIFSINYQMLSKLDSKLPNQAPTSDCSLTGILQISSKSQKAEIQDIPQQASSAVAKRKPALNENLIAIDKTIHYQSDKEPKVKSTRKPPMQRLQTGLSNTRHQNLELTTLSTTNQVAQTPFRSEEQMQPKPFLNFRIKNIQVRTSSVQGKIKQEQFQSNLSKNDLSITTSRDNSNFQDFIKQEEITLQQRPTYSSVDKRQDLVRVQTSPVRLRLQSKPQGNQLLPKRITKHQSITESISETDQIYAQASIFPDINYIKSSKLLYLYKGYRNINQFTTVILVHYSAVRRFYFFMQDFFSKSKNEGQKITVKLQAKQFLNKLKKDSILVMVLEERMKLNVLGSSVLDAFDFVFSQIKTVSAPHAWKKLQNNMGLDVQPLLEQIAGRTIQTIINLDSLPSEFKPNDNMLEISRNQKDLFNCKIPIANEMSFKIVNILVCRTSGITLSLAQTIQKLLQVNRNVPVNEFILENTFKELVVSGIVEDCIKDSKELQVVEYKFKEIDILKSELKKQPKNLENDSLLLDPEKRIEILRNQMIEHIKKKSISKISNMHFIIGDVIVRNIGIFKGQEETKLYSEKNRQILSNLEAIISSDKGVPGKSKNQSNYFFYYYLEQ